MGCRKKSLNMGPGVNYNQVSEIVVTVWYRVIENWQPILFAKLFCSQQYSYTEFWNDLVPYGDMRRQVVYFQGEKRDFAYFIMSFIKQVSCYPIYTTRVNAFTLASGIHHE